jgi:DNA-binding IclR family transcriptional regulator
MTTTYSNGKKGDDADLSGVKTLQKALAILDAFAAAERPLTIAEVAVRAGVTRPTAYRLIQTLVAAGYLAQQAGDARIAPGYSVLRLAANLLDTNLIRLESLPHLENLARITGERVSLGILHRHEMLYIAGVEKPSLPTIYSRFGKTSPAYCSALGKSILAHLSEDELRDYLQHQEMIRHTSSTIADEAALRAELMEVPAKGIRARTRGVLPWPRLHRRTDHAARQAGRCGRDHGALARTAAFACRQCAALRGSDLPCAEPRRLRRSCCAPSSSRVTISPTSHHRREASRP